MTGLGQVCLNVQAAGLEHVPPGQVSLGLGPVGQGLTPHAVLGHFLDLSPPG